MRFRFPLHPFETSARNPTRNLSPDTFETLTGHNLSYALTEYTDLAEIKHLL